MSTNNQRMKWWEKYRNKEVNHDVSRNTADLRDLARAAFLRLLYTKINLTTIDKVIDNIIQKAKADYSEEEILCFIIQCLSEPNEQKEDVGD